MCVCVFEWNMGGYVAVSILKLIPQTNSPARCTRNEVQDTPSPRLASTRHLYFVFASQVTKVLVRNLNKIIDVNWYPVEEAQKSNVRHRPMGIGVQGLADTFIKVCSGSGRRLVGGCPVPPAPVPPSLPHHHINRD